IGMTPIDIFAKDNGTWDAEVIVRPGPGLPEQHSKGVSEQYTVGGRWLVVDFKNETGFEGHGIYGWDETRKAFVATWVDPMRTLMTIMEGQWDAAKRTLTLEGRATLPDGRTLEWREVTEHLDENTKVFRQLWGNHEMMTVTYRRRSS